MHTLSMLSACYVTYTALKVTGLEAAARRWLFGACQTEPTDLGQSAACLSCSRTAMLLIGDNASSRAWLLIGDNASSLARRILFEEHTGCRFMPIPVQWTKVTTFQRAANRAWV
jgi:hypothetical protein